MKWRSQQKILFIGDSITDARRREEPYAPLGCGYVHFAGYFLQARFPELDLQVENRGISGDTTRELLARWKEDCLDLQPDVVTVLIGINDLWRAYKPVLEPQKTSVVPEEYENNLRQMLSGVQRFGSRLILMEPFYFCSDLQEPMRHGLDAYLGVVHRLARDYQVVLIPLQRAYEQLSRQVPDARWSEDKVHPSPWAHAWIARQWLSAVLDRDI